MKTRKYFIILVIGFLLWIGETAYFGFNDKPQSGLEALLDSVSLIMIGYGLIGDLMQNVTIIKKYYHTHNINTKKVIVTGKNPKLDYNFGTTKEETRDLLTPKETTK